MNIINCAKCGNHTVEDTEDKGGYEKLCPTCKAEYENSIVEFEAWGVIDNFSTAIETIYDEHQRGKEPTLLTLKKMQDACCQFFDFKIPVQ